MKKLLLSLAAIVALFATSCVTDATDTLVRGDQCTVTFTVAPDAFGTRAAINDGTKATQLSYAVYKSNWEFLFEGEATMNGLSATIPVQLVKNNTYNFVFWAQSPEASYYTVDFKAAGGPLVTVDYTGAQANDDKRDAFFGRLENYLVTGPISATVTLTRPFAQVNFATNDTVLAEKAGFNVANATTTVTIEAFSTLNLATGTVDGLKTVTFAATANPTETLTVKGSDVEWDWLAMNYILWDADEASLSKCEMTIATNNMTSITVEVPAAPAKRNWRTNLVGSLLIEQGNIEIIVDQKFEGENVVVITNQDEFDAALKSNVTLVLADGEYNLTRFPGGAAIIGNGDNVVLNAPEIISVQGDVTIENVTLLNSNAGYKGFQDTNNVNIKNSTIYGQPFLYAKKAVYDGCTFAQYDETRSNKDNYNVWTYAAKDVLFKNCVFNCDGRCVLIYSEDAALEQTVTFEGCAFNAATPANDGKAAIEIGAHMLTTGLYTVNINNCTSNGFDEGSVSGNTLWNVKKGNRVNVTVDGEMVFVASAENVANGLWKSGSKYSVTNAEGLALLNSKMCNKTAGRAIVVELLSDIDFTGKTWTPVDSQVDFGFTIAEFNGNGHTISNLTINGQAMFSRFSNTANVVFKNVTFDNATVNHNYINTAIIVGHTYDNLLLDNVDVKNSTIVGGYKVAPLVATVYNEGASTITATLKNCDVENTVVKAISYDFCTTGMVAFVYADDNDKIEFENCTVSNVNLYAPNVYTAHAAIYTTGSETLFNEAEGVTVTNVTFENI